jgi:RNA polymerase sigma factor (sigma-70 family)
MASMVRDEAGSEARRGVRRSLPAWSSASDRRARTRAPRHAAGSREVIAEQVPGPDPSPPDHDRLPDRLLLLDALAQLEDRQRATVILRYWEYLSVDETAAALDCSPETVRSEASRALATLRSALPEEAWIGRVPYRAERRRDRAARGTAALSDARRS